MHPCCSCMCDMVVQSVAEQSGHEIEIGTRMILVPVGDREDEDRFSFSPLLLSQQHGYLVAVY